MIEGEPLASLDVTSSVIGFFFLFFFFLNLNAAPLETEKKIIFFEEKTLFSIMVRVSCVCVCVFFSLNGAEVTSDSTVFLSSLPCCTAFKRAKLFCPPNNPEGMNALRSTDVGVYCDSVCFCVLSRTSFCSWWIGSDTLAGGWCHFLVSVVSVRKCRYLDSGPVKRQLFICYNQNNKLGHHRRTDMFCSFIVIVVFVCAFLDGIGAAVHKKMLSQL